MEPSKFFDYLRASNGPALAGLVTWFFQPGMLFNSLETWWGERRPRPTPHEGIDLCFFKDGAGQVRQVGPDLKIPATFAGEIIKLDRDFLGKSIYLGHEIFAADGRRLYTAYGHTRPVATLKVGNRVAAGEIIATIAPVPGRKTRALPHLHLTLAWMDRAMAPARLTWQNLGHDPDITLLDPLTVCPTTYSV
jgi:murein DD-endopeptidase MepM/ murein hydrolase activator NlpD